MKLTKSKLKQIIKEEFGNINEGQEIKDIGTLAKALEAHGIAIEPSSSETTLTINTDLGQATIRIEGPGGIKYGVY